MFVHVCVGDTGELVLDNPENDFEQGATNTFQIMATDVGVIERMKISISNESTAWHMKTATVT